MNNLSDHELIRELVQSPDFKAKFAAGSEHLARIKYRNKGMFPSEILAFCVLAKALNLNRVFESGMAKGYSTECLVALHVS